MKADILIRNGYVLDPAAGREGIGDVAVSAGKMAASDACEITGSTRVIDAAGCFVFPGLIDFHSHLFWGGSNLGIMPDLMLSQGVTTAVDAGTAGWIHYRNFYHTVISHSELRIKSFLNVYPEGLLGSGVPDRPSPELFNEEEIRRAVREYPDNIIGLKVRLGRESVGDKGLYVLRQTVALAEKIGKLRVCVHVTNAESSAAEIAEALRPGDIFCHMYQGKGKSTILDDGGRLSPAVAEARSRGVLFDAANGNNHFDFEIARGALEQGFGPDIISSDFTKASVCSSTRLRTFAFIMSKYLNMGVALADIIRAVTQTPAGLMNEEGHLGTLRPEAEADITIMKSVEKSCVFRDTKDRELKGDRLLVPQLTVKGGRLLYCATDFDI